MKKFLPIFITIFTIIFSHFSPILAIENVVADEKSEKSESSESPPHPEIFIRAIDPGYTIDGKSNVGEFIELAREPSDTPLLLTGLIISYTNSSGNSATLFEFPEGSQMIGESILLRLASSPDSELADLNYSKTLAMSAGPLSLIKNDETLDSICWTGKDGCAKPFVAATPTSLVRDPDTFEFSHQSDYQPTFSPGGMGYQEIKPTEEVLPKQCLGLRFSEILSYYETSKSEQFIEFYNTTSEPIKLDGCRIRYKNKYYSLSGSVQPEEYHLYLVSDFSLTKNPTTENLLELIDLDGSTSDSLTYRNGQKKSASFALFGYDTNGEDLWKITYHPTPGEANIFQEYRTCEAGKVINTATGNCVKIAEETAEKVCEEGKYLNPLTNRCKSYDVTTEKVCDEGYYLNPETNRCKKIKNNDGANYSLDPTEYEGKSSFAALWAVLAVVLLGVIYIIFQFRHEIKKFFDKVFRRAR